MTACGLFGGWGRTIVLTDQSTMLRGRTIAPLPWQWLPKEPIQKTTRSVDFRNLLCGRSIVSAAYACEGVTVGAVVVSGSAVTLLFSDGTNGIPAQINVRAICSDGTDEPVTVTLPIIQTLFLSGGDTVTASCPPVTTIGTAGGVLGPLPIFAAAGASVAVRGTILGRNLATDDTVTFDAAFTVKGYGSSSPTIVGQGTVVTTADSDMAACTATPNATAAGITFALVGVAGATILWSENLQCGIA